MVDNAQGSPEQGEASRTAGRRILVVIGNVLERAKLRKVLEGRQHQVRDAKDAKQAMGVLSEVPIDLAVIDLELQGMSGRDLMHEMEEEGLAVPIIVIARDTSVEAAVECMRHGAVNILSRPYDDKAFVGAIQGALMRQQVMAGRQGGAAAPTDGPAGRSKTTAPAGNEPAGDPAAEAEAASQLPAVRHVKLQLDQGSLNLPTIPAVLKELRRLLDDPKYNTSQLVKLVEADQELAVKVLRRANSVAFRGYSAVSSIGNALVRLGGRSVLSIALRTMTDRMCRTLRSPELSDLSVDLWRRSVEVALAARIVARELAGAEPEEFYLHGLLSEVGEPFLLRFVDDLLRDKPQALNIAQARQEIAEYHAEVGSALLDRWGMKEEAVLVARHHHDLSHMREAVATRRPVGKVLFAIALARHVVRHANRGRLQSEAQRSAMREALAEGRDAESVVVPEIELEPGHKGDPEVDECQKVLRLRAEQFDRIVRSLRTEIETNDHGLLDADGIAQVPA